MKNKLIVATLFLVTGIVVGNKLYNKVDLKLIQAFNESNNFFILQEGIYDTKESMQSETRDINPKIYEEKDNKFYVYVGVTSNEENAKKIKNIYKTQNKEILIKNINIKDEDFITNLKQFDILIENTNNVNEILTIEEVVLASFNKKNMS